MGILSKPRIDRLRMFSMYGIAFTLAFSFLNMNSIFIMLLSLTWLLEGGFKQKLKSLSNNIVFYAFTAYFLILLLGISNAGTLSIGWKYIEAEVGLIVLPILMCSISMEKQKLRSIMIMFLVFLTAASLYCLADRTILFFHSRETSIFFYHSLLQPIDHHAVYFSIFLFVATIFFLREMREIRISKWIKAIWLTYCVFILILLSSKLVLLFMLVYLAYLVFVDSFNTRKIWYKVLTSVLVAGVVVLIFEIDNPLKRRFQDVLTPNTELLKEKFDRATYFNGIEFRLLLWRVTYDILKENHAWVMGVGPTNAQSHLNKKYLELDLYAGHSVNRGEGYLIYNCHNQFLQTSLQSGIVGLAALMFLYVCLVIQSFRTKDPVLITFMLLLVCFSFVESVFERQYGVLLFAWLTESFLRSNSKKHDQETNRKTSSA